VTYGAWRAVCVSPVRPARLQLFDKLLTGINDIVENRIESNLRSVSKVLIVNFSNSGSFTPETFVRDNMSSVSASTAYLQVRMGVRAFDQPCVGRGAGKGARPYHASLVVFVLCRGLLWVCGLALPCVSVA
jgi:hypothetical protein